MWCLSYQLPELWGAACCSEEEDLAGILEDPAPPSQWISTRTGFAEFHKLKWLARQGALQALGYKERLLELMNRKNVEQNVMSLESMTHLDEESRNQLRVKQRMMLRLRQMSAIQSDLKSSGRAVQKVLRSMTALQLAHPSGSEEYMFIESLLNRPWASIDLSQIASSKRSSIVTEHGGR